MEGISTLLQAAIDGQRMSQTEKREWMYMRNKHIVFSYFSFSSHAFCFVYINLRLCWNHQLVVWVLHMNKLLSIQDRVSGWGQSPLYTPPPPSPIELIVDHMERQAYVLFCLATSVWKVVKTFFPTFFPLPCPHVLLFGVLCPQLYWAEYVYVASVVKVPLINLFWTQVMWFCLLQ